jgi:hypothetical protein
MGVLKCPYRLKPKGLNVGDSDNCSGTHVDVNFFPRFRVGRTHMTDAQVF